MSVAAGFINLPGGGEWIIIFLVILIIFGPKNLPKIGNAIGRGIREFKDASEGITKAIEEEVSSESNYKYEEPEAGAPDKSEGSPASTESSESTSNSPDSPEPDEPSD